jgi:hypothetical protein
MDMISVDVTEEGKDNTYYIRDGKVRRNVKE